MKFLNTSHLYVLPLIFLISGTLGCATLLKGPFNSVSFRSSQPKTKVYINDELVGITPLDLKLSPKTTFDVEFRKEGFETKVVPLNKLIGTDWIILDIVFGAIPAIIDAGTGNWYNFEKDHISVILEKK